MMFKHTLPGLGCILAFSLPWLAQAQTASNADKAFMKMAAQIDMTEAHIGQMAESRGSASQVRDFGQKLTHDHTDAYDQLAAVAAKTGAAIPKGIDIRKIPAVEQLMNLKGPQFDHLFAQEEVRDHQKALAEFKREAQHGQNPDVKTYAGKMIPVLEDHLHTAEALARSAKRRSGA